MNKPKPKPKKNFLFIAILFVVPFLLYIQTSKFNFTYHDDDSIVLYNSKALEDFNLKKFFFTDAWMLEKKIELYRPLQSFSYSIDYYFSKASPVAYHVQNTLMFCAGIVLLYFLLLSFGITEQNSFLLSLIYSVHLLFAHTVSWIPARGDLYLFFFSVLAILSYNKFLDTGKNLHQLLCAVFYFLALLSKESAIILLPLIFILARLFWKFNFKNPRNYLVLIPAIVFTALYLWMRAQSINSVQNIFSPEGFLYNIRIIPEEVCKFFLPVFFSVMPTFNLLITSIGIILIAAIASGFFLLRKKMNAPIFLAGLCFFLLPILPSIIYKPAFTGFAYDYLDHRMFFPAIGLLLIAYSIIQSINLNGPTKVYKALLILVNIGSLIFLGAFYEWTRSQIELLGFSVISFLFLILILIPAFRNPGKLINSTVYSLVGLMFINSFIHAKAYSDYKTYYGNAIDTNHKSALAEANLAAALARDNDYDGALKHFNQSVLLSPDNIEVRMKLADSYYHVKDFEKMNEQCKAVIQLNPKFARAYFDIALGFFELKKNDSSFHYVDAAIAADTTNAEAWMYKAMMFENIGQKPEAAALYSKAIQMNPDLASAYFQRGNYYGSIGKFSDAEADYNNYVRLVPNDGKGYFYRGEARCLAGNKDAGCEDLHTALQMGVPDAQKQIDYWCR